MLFRSSRATIVEAPLAEAAVVYELLIVPLAIAEAFKLVNAEPLPECAPLKVVAVIVAAEKLPEASLATIVEAPLEAVAVVFAFGKVPVTLDCRLQ